MGHFSSAFANSRLDKMLVERELAAIKRDIEQVCTPAKVMVFGSAARGEARLGSDLDIAVFAHTRDEIPALRKKVLQAVTAKAIPVDWVFADLESLRNPALSNGILDQILRDGREL